MQYCFSLCELICIYTFSQQMVAGLCARLSFKCLVPLRNIRP